MIELLQLFQDRWQFPYCSRYAQGISLPSEIGSTFWAKALDAPA